MIKRFHNAVDAQEYYLSKRDPMYCHWNYEDNQYVMTYQPAINANNKVISIEIMERTTDDEYVYDIETEDGTFQAGVGCMILKNTDSIYTQFSLPDQDKMEDPEKLDKIFKVSKECADRISDTFKKPIELEMENIMYPCMLFAKKRYVKRCMVQTWDGKIKDKGIDAKGIQLVRRDNCKLVKKVSTAVLNKIMFERDILGAEEIARKFVSDLLDNKFKMEDLMITKSLKAHYSDENKNGGKLSKPAHWHLAQKMKERDPMTAPAPGSRVPYIFIENGDKNAQQKDRVEDPEYAEKHKIKVDTLYYLDKQISSPLETLFSVLVKDSEGNLFEYDSNGKVSKECKKEIARRIWDNARLRKENRNKGQMEINSFFTKKT